MFETIISVAALIYIIDKVFNGLKDIGILDFIFDPIIDWLMKITSKS